MDFDADEYLEKFAWVNVVGDKVILNTKVIEEADTAEKVMTVGWEIVSAVKLVLEEKMRQMERQVSGGYTLGVVLFNRTPIFLLARNAFFRGNVGFVGAFMLVSAFLGYVDGRSEHEILLDLMMGLFLSFMAVRAYGTESKMYKYIWGEAYYKMQKILLCDPTSLSEKEAEIHRQYNDGEHNLTFEQQVTVMAVDLYIEQHRRFDEKYEKEHKMSAFIGNVALFIIILNIIYSIATHI